MLAGCATWRDAVHNRSNCSDRREVGAPSLESLLWSAHRQATGIWRPRWVSWQLIWLLSPNPADHVCYAPRRLEGTNSKRASDIIAFVVFTSICFISVASVRLDRVCW